MDVLFGGQLFDCLCGDGYFGDVRDVGVVSSVGGDVLEC